MNFSEHVKEKLTKELNATQVDIIDDSWRHAGHHQNRSGFSDGTHLQITIVSEAFKDVSILDQHRMVHQVLKEEMATRIHALALKTLTPETTA